MAGFLLAILFLVPGARELAVLNSIRDRDAGGDSSSHGEGHRSAGYGEVLGQRFSKLRLRIRADFRAALFLRLLW